jgi:hypothetical protein
MLPLVISFISILYMKEELTEVTLKRLQYKEMNDMKRRELEKTIYKNADWIDKIKIRLRRFFEKRSSKALV